MTNEDKKLIFDYCGWKPDRFLCQDECENIFYGELDGNDMLEAAHTIRSNGDWTDFELVAKRAYDNNKVDDAGNLFYSPFLLQNFFPLMTAWLKERKT